MPDNPQLSIVSTLYRSKPFLDRFIARCQEAALAAGFLRYEFVFVNDGSPDDSLEYLRSLQPQHPNMRIVNLSRNFGHHAAITAGLANAKGELVYLIDCDLEVDPMFLVALHNKLQSQEADVVFGYQEKRKGNFAEKRLGGMFWKILNALSDIKIPENILTERLMTQQYVQALLSLGDRNLFLGGMMAWTGFRQLGEPYAKKQREGASTYTIGRRFSLLVDALSSFTSRPLFLMFYAGLIITGLSMLLGFWWFFQKLLFPHEVLSGFTSLSTLISFSTGIITSCLGLIGIYLSKIFKQVQNRPVFIIKDIF